VTGVQTCALPISSRARGESGRSDDQSHGTDHRPGGNQQRADDEHDIDDDQRPAAGTPVPRQDPADDRDGRHDDQDAEHPGDDDGQLLADAAPPAALPNPAPSYLMCVCERPSSGETMPLRDIMTQPRAESHVMEFRQSSFEWRVLLTCNPPDQPSNRWMVFLGRYRKGDRYERRHTSETPPGQPGGHTIPRAYNCTNRGAWT